MPKVIIGSCTGECKLSYLSSNLRAHFGFPMHSIVHRTEPSLHFTVKTVPAEIKSIYVAFRVHAQFQRPVPTGILSSV